MVKSIAKALELTVKETMYWRWAAWTLPFVALALVVTEYLLGWDSALQKTVISIVVIFFGVSVYWWWWALTRIILLLSALKKTEESFEEIKHELRLTREELKKK